LLRHAKAVPKGNWKRPDAARPLDDAGRSDAKALADLLACFAARPRLISSPAVRCADTLRPLSHLTGAPVREEPSLYIHHGNSSRTTAADSGTTITALIREAVASGEPTVICAHRENLPVLQEAALAALAGHPGAEIPAAELPGGAPDDVAGGPIAALPREWDDELPTSGFWVLNVAPLPAPPEPPLEPQQPAPDPALAAPAAPAPPAPDVPPPGQRWWRRLRALPSRGGALGPAAGATGAAAAVAGPAVMSADTAGADGSAGGAGRGPADGGTDLSGAPRAGEAGQGGTARLAGVLISADRYDLSEP
jgi:phosphohistidine phosphatase SixA